MPELEDRSPDVSPACSAFFFVMPRVPDGAIKD